MIKDRPPAGLTLEEWANLGLPSAQEALTKKTDAEVQEPANPQDQEKVPPSGMPKSFWKSLGVGSN